MSAAICAGPAQAKRGIDVGLTDGVFNGAERAPWLDRAQSARAESILLGASWAGIAPGVKPSREQARNPGFSGYSWADLDASVRATAARGMRPSFLVTGAPAWAEGRKRPSFEKAAAGTWKPSPSKLGDFARAIAKRYSGSFDPDGVLGAPKLPRVRDYQLWAEPNLATYLTPQYKKRRYVAPRHYRKMLRGFFDGINAVDRKNAVITGGTAPYGDFFRGGRRIPPVAFWREVLCLKGRRALNPTGCKKPAKFDVLAHHPINIGRPQRHAQNPDDASTPDIGRIKRVLRKAQRADTVLPGGKKKIWATEIWWDSKPPDPNGVPERKHAKYLADSFYLLWKQGVKRVVWFQIRDQDCGSNCAASPQTGLFLRNGTPKLAYDAFRFPFVAKARGKRTVYVWGLAPNGGKVIIERKRNGAWRKVAQTEAGGNRVFAKKFRLAGGAKLRARAGGDNSLARSVR